MAPAPPTSPLHTSAPSPAATGSETPAAWDDQARREPASPHQRNAQPHLPTSSPTHRAIFLDRDGVLNPNIFYRDTGAWESPRTAPELTLTPGAGLALRQLHAAGFLLILVSNQPNAAKGKSTPAELDRIHARLVQLLAAEGVTLDQVFYCFHHPDHGAPCLCRKPSAHFLHQAARQFSLTLPECWMIGDRPTDIACGLSAGTGTVWIDNNEEVAPPSDATLHSPDLPTAVTQLLRLTATAAGSPPLS